VTPENQCQCPLVKAFGPHPNGDTMPPAFSRWLGYQPPERGDYFTELDAYLRTHLKGNPRNC